MTAAAELVLCDGEIRLGEESYDAVAVRNGRIVWRGADYEAQFRTGVETTVVELDGRTVAPGFVDARAGFEGGLDAVRQRAHAAGVTAVHAAADPERAARCRDAAAAGELDVRVRLQYPDALRSALVDAGLRTNHGEQVETGALVLTADEPDLRERAVRAAEAGFQVAVEATDRQEADAAARALAACRPRRHRIEGAVPHPDALAEFGDVVVAGGGEAGLAAVPDSDATLALGGGVPLETLARAVESGLSPAEAFRAHTRGGRFAGFDADASRADLVAFDGDPFDSPADVSVALTVANGAVVRDAR